MTRSGSRWMLVLLLLCAACSRDRFDWERQEDFMLSQSEQTLDDGAVRMEFVSLPKRWHVLTPQRWVRYTFFRCFVRFYSRTEVERLAASVGPRRTTILDIGREYNLRLDLE